jgi:hypothetical protein
VNSDGIELDLDFLNDDLSSAIGTDTLITNNIVPEGFQASSGKKSDLPIQLINGKR